MTNEKSTKEYWDDRVLESGGDPMALVYESPGFQKTQEISETMIKQFVKKGDRILDVGCGYGRFYQAFKNAGAEYTGIDFSKEMIKLAREKHPDGIFILEDFNDRRNVEGFYDVVFECICLSSIASKDADDFGRNLARLVKKDTGILIMIEPQGVSAFNFGGNLFL